MDEDSLGKEPSTGESFRAYISYNQTNRFKISPGKGVDRTGVQTADKNLQQPSRVGKLAGIGGFGTRRLQLSSENNLRPWLIIIGNT